MIAVIRKRGAFSLDAKDWFGTRADFASVFNEETKGFFFAHSRKVKQNIKVFISKIETILDLAHKRTRVSLPFEPPIFCNIFSPTNIFGTGEKTVAWIEPSNFWKDCPIKRSLFTLLLRCGEKYNCTKDNFEEALLSNNQIRETHNALIRFLFGFVKFNPIESYENLPGWYMVFAKKNYNFIKRTLVRPDYEPAQSELGIDGLWT
jgi:hypothetical protein